ncbi:tRNA-dihydrouridine synthase family protein [Ruminococcus sp. AF37-6AT]|jgi:tRNA-dihydrouridine synthase|uniref:tRNA dihydrouridine synthase n=1 Tax=Blautia sp. HCN-1074 TaxID=3134667 RepID=UPI000E4422A1|nr:tRNA-dihydrouridine synthase family protein [uncultured Blautia sp.]MBS6711007.1 tRNA-dihydrouridine synthase family protein [Ruminococcus sp.]RGI63709.1 tRNA-dihydrouridine synthase family protein [Ruminococcus sp. TM10-9AT]RGW22240.1 tRNA-dihydrouridine synthase family protein [Ruminococcus sp. AF13-37]RGW23984.1 tRNA-dihydrouridine synthase family protein [Ruminococcus sp. AF13-28]RHD95254.1 tRNA-dihydrouridine synthase family protein [Ruminococcus sp. AM30-15AC]RHJ95896.1 tRNA-dihydrou
MKIYLAPLEGITGYTYRRALHQCFGGFDKYFIPFILPNQKGHLSTREKKDIAPENNEGMYAVPQILTKNAEDFIRTAETLQEYGYNEVNLNLGCPSKTVVTKGRGAGFLDRPDELDKFLDEIFRKCDVKISIKTRLGMDAPDEFEDLLTIYNKYPLEELIIHPRVQKDYYKNTPRLETFGEALEHSKTPVCYNGDIVTAKDYLSLKERFPALECIMTGRGTLRNPALAREIRGGAPASKEEIRRFHDIMYNEYCEDLSGDRNILFRMKELWSYLIPMFTNNKKYAKKIKKTEKCVVYESAVRELFSCEQLIDSNDDSEKITGTL